MRLSPWIMVAVVLAAGGCKKSGAPRPNEETELRARLQAALVAKGRSYVPRTRHRHPDGAPRFTNRLILESSPYLLQHAHNPVDWYAWGEEAFERARLMHRPVFLSVGYSTCHWCHVMEEESFEDEEVARYLNDHYVAIKVDREERPDIDAVYMSFVQALTGNGGWPMSVWLTEAREPFFGGTYFPPRAGARGSRRGFIDLLREQSERLAADPMGVTEGARETMGRIRTASAPEPPGDFPPASILKMARSQAARRFDPSFGGQRGSPKFPSSFPTRLLLRIARRTNDADARSMATTTLDHMRAGGIYDQVGGGFHRYSTDARWLVPHFEKTLYDNALLALEYLEASQATGEARFANTARETLDYLLRDMTAPDGTWYSGTDADSALPSGRREEGIFFTWTPGELVNCLGSDDARLASTWFGASAMGNFEGRSILSAERRVEDVARELTLQPRTVDERLPAIRARLREARSHRSPPLRDDKVVVAWNGLALSAFARAALVLGDERYGAAALRAASVLIAPIHAGRPLPHVIIEGHERGIGFADDHMALANALLDVFELTAEPSWLVDAIRLMDDAERAFADSTNGGYFLSSDTHERLLLRERPDHDGPVPSANSLAALAWLRLYTLTDDERFRVRAEKTLRAFAGTLLSRPLALDQMLLALDWATDTVKELVIVVPDGHGALTASARPMLDVLQHSFVPNAVTVVATEADLAGLLGQRAPWVRDKVLRAGRATAYVCERGACKMPTNDPATLASQLAEAKPLQ